MNIKPIVRPSWNNNIGVGNSVYFTIFVPYVYEAETVIAFMVYKKVLRDTFLRSKHLIMLVWGYFFLVIVIEQLGCISASSSFYQTIIETVGHGSPLKYLDHSVFSSQPKKQIDSAKRRPLLNIGLPQRKTQRPVQCRMHPAVFRNLHQVISRWVVYPGCLLQYAVAIRKLLGPINLLFVLRAMCPAHCHLSFEILPAMSIWWYPL